MQLAVIAEDRRPHWIKRNHQCRIPKRWVTVGVRYVSEVDGNVEKRSWGSASAIAWRTDVVDRDACETADFTDPSSLWAFVADYCRPHCRTVVVSYNLSNFARLSALFSVLPTLGFDLVWCNLDRGVSSMTWRGERGTIVFMDIFTYIPKSMSDISGMVHSPDSAIPWDGSDEGKDTSTCRAHAGAMYAAAREIIEFIRDGNLGNWQPTGAGMAYSIWRHRFLEDKILVHSDVDVLSAERAAMHTGRTEAHRHGRLTGDAWYEVDMRNAYTRIAADTEVPIKFKYKTGEITLGQYEKLTGVYAVLAECDVTTTVPVVPYFNGERTIWPVGSFRTWLWDVEINELLGEGQSVHIRKACLYTKSYALRGFGRYVLSNIEDRDGTASQVVRVYSKHCGRSLIGRLALRVASWEEYGANPMLETGISFSVDITTGEINRMMHVGDKTMIETARVEGHDSVPQITSKIVAECRVRLWWAMRSAGLENIAHVDTDSLIVNREGLARMRETYGPQFDVLWQIKSVYYDVTVHGPRNLIAGGGRKMSGIPVSATRNHNGTYTGEKWSGLSADMQNGRADSITVATITWTPTNRDPRRGDAAGADGFTVPLVVQPAG